MTKSNKFVKKRDKKVNLGYKNSQTIEKLLHNRTKTNEFEQ